MAALPPRLSTTLPNTVTRLLHAANTVARSPSLVEIEDASFVSMLSLVFDAHNVQYALLAIRMR